MANQHARTNINKGSYLIMTSIHQSVKKIPKGLAHEVYDCIHKWFGMWPHITPPLNVQDLINHAYDNYELSERNSNDDEVTIVESNPNGNQLKHFI